MDMEQIDQMIGQIGDEPLTDEQMARLLTGNGEIAGDDGGENADPEIQAKSEGEPAPATDEVKVEAKADEKPVVLAKDGVHTIEYEKLVEARDEAKVAKEQARTLQEQLAAIQAERDDLQARMAEAAKQDEDTGTTQATDEVLASFKEDYPEFYAVLQRETAAVSQALLSRIDALEKMTGQLTGQLAPVIEKSQTDAVTDHLNAIRSGVEGYDQIKAQSDKVHAWLDTQPASLRSAYSEILDQGSAKDVIAVLNTFKAATGFQVEAGKTPPATGKKVADVDALITAARQKHQVPTTLSDIPASSSVPHDEAAAMLEMTSVSLMDKFNGKTPDQILDLIGRVV
jgi:hypothetical protein